MLQRRALLTEVPGKENENISTTAKRTEEVVKIYNNICIVAHIKTQNGMKRKIQNQNIRLNTKEE